ncbi:hypothetical protein ACQ86N_36500 [Puia sp. P3]|uniref:hypothetical protein n=1 Tax=Puia sp. P3 TaxID=3423952 RepID=UPI003D666E2D
MQRLKGSPAEVVDGIVMVCVEFVAVPVEFEPDAGESLAGGVDRGAGEPLGR